MIGKFNRDREGLIHLMEFITSFTIFIIVMAVFFSTVAMEYSRLNTSDNGRYLRDKANICADLIVNTPGYLEKPPMPFIDDFHNMSSAWALSPDDGSLSTLGNMGELQSNGTAHTIYRTSGAPNTTIYQVDFFVKNSTDSIIIGVYDGGSILSPNNLVAVYGSGSDFVLRTFDGSYHTVYTFSEVTYSPGNWYSLDILKNSSGIITISLSYKDGAWESKTLYTIPSNWDCRFAASNINGTLVLRNYMEYAPWEYYSFSDIKAHLKSLGLSRGTESNGEIDIKKVYILQEIFKDPEKKKVIYPMFRAMFGLEPYENMLITITSTDGSTTYLHAGAEMEGVDDMGSASRYIKLYSEDNFIGMAILRVYIFHGGAY